MVIFSETAFVADLRYVKMKPLLPLLCIFLAYSVTQTQGFVCKPSSHLKTSSGKLSFTQLFFTLPFMFRSNPKLEVDEYSEPYSNILSQNPGLSSFASQDSFRPLSSTPPLSKEVSRSDVATASEAAQETSKAQVIRRTEVSVARFISWVLKKIVQSRVTYATGLDIKILAASNRQLLSGKVDTVELSFDKIAFGSIFVSGGGKLVAEGLAIKMRSFFFNDLNSLRRPYKIHGDFQLTQEDIVNSKFIKGLIQLLMNTILERALQVSLLPSTQHFIFSLAYLIE